MTGFVEYTKKYLLSFIQLQLVLTFVSLPILISWGLPLSLFSFIGNLIFSPFLTAFLCVSSLLFFTELLHIPNSALVYLLEQITHIWTTALSYGPSSALIGFCLPPLWILIMIPLIMIGLLIHKSISSIKQRIIACSGLLIITCTLLKLVVPTKIPSITNIPVRNSNVTLIAHQGTITLIDRGAIGRCTSAENYVEYTLLPTITKLTGAVHIDTLILLHPTKRLFNAIAHLSNLAPITTIYLVVWDKDIKDTKFWHAFWKCKNSIEKKQSTFKRFGPKQHSIPVSQTSSVELTPTSQTIRKYGALIPQFTLELVHNTQRFTLG